jgi:hypothetical protein
MIDNKRPINERPRAGSIVRFTSEPDGPLYYVKAVWDRSNHGRRTVAALALAQGTDETDPRIKRLGTYRSVLLTVVRHTKPVEASALSHWARA